MLKKITFLVLAVSLTVGLEAEKNYLNVSGQTGVVVNSQRDKKLGIGGSVAWLMQDDFMSKSGKNYTSLTMKIFNNPYQEGKFLKSMFNNEDDGFNYVALLAGYRVNFQNISNGFFVEPRLGVGIFADKKPAFVVSPLVGFAYRNFDFGAYCDLGFKNKPFATQKNNFITVGLSVGYGFGL
ncbi:MAG: hypothetical protein GX102_15740 [Porphyromonadaceae bacterium]|jgi:hypothetical protein|nr:hypothetical protein [Porphyromonadaceae bacterium]